MNAIVNAAVLALGGAIGAGAIALWAALEPSTVENVSTMDPRRPWRSASSFWRGHEALDPIEGLDHRIEGSRDSAVDLTDHCHPGCVRGLPAISALRGYGLASN